jgi:hypothetical protein
MENFYIPKNIITQVRYGISNEECIDITSFFFDNFKSNWVYGHDCKMNEYFGDPYPDIPKKIYISTDDDLVGIVEINELHNKLIGNIYFKKEEKDEIVEIIKNNIIKYNNNNNKKTMNSRIYISKKMIKSVKYGISTEKYINITEKFINMLDVLELKWIIGENFKINNYFGDPFPNILKKLFIYLKNGEIIKINELNGVLTNNIHLKKNENENENIIIMLSHKGGGGLSKYVNDVIDIQVEKHKSLQIITNEPNNNCSVNVLSSDNILKYIKKISTPVLLHINIHPYYYNITLNKLDDFVNTIILKKNIKIILTIHDYFWLFINKPNITNIDFYKSSAISSNICQKIFNHSNLVIFPTKFMIDRYKQKNIKFENVNYIVTDHPDIDITQKNIKFEKVNHINITKRNNNKIKLLFIGATLNHKGFDLILNVLRKSNLKYNIELHILGSTTRRIYPKIRKVKIIYFGKYENKNIFNIINTISPKLILLMSICAETWSYVLSIAIATGLPLFYNNIGSYKERIEKLNKKDVMSFQEDVDTIGNICEKLNNFIVYLDTAEIPKKNNKPIQFKTLSTPFYDNLYIKKDFLEIESKYNFDDEMSNFINNMHHSKKFLNDFAEHKNIVIITSKIIVSQNKLSYIKNRSIYSIEERYKQTLETIESIRKYIPNSYIIMFDNTEFEENIYKKISNVVDVFINPINDKYIYEYTNICPYKQIAELSQLKYILHYISNKKIKFTNLFKISGRYIINSNFDYNKYKNNNNIMKKNNNVNDRLYYYTCFYKIHYDNFNDYINSINTVFNKCLIDDIYAGNDLEVNFPHHLSFKQINTLGITQRISVWTRDDGDI